MRHRVLVVDDEPTILAALERFLRLRGFDVVCVRDLESATHALTAGAFAVAIVDVHLGPDAERAGLEVVSRARAQPEPARVIVLTAHGSPELEREARERGADAFLAKPVPLSEVTAVVGALLGDSGQAGP